MDFLQGLYRALSSGLLLLLTALISIRLIRYYGRSQNISQLTRSTGRYFVGCLVTVLAVFVYQFIQVELAKSKFMFSEAYNLPYSYGDWQFLVLVLLSSCMVYSLMHILHNSVLLQHLRTENELEVSKLRTINAETTNQLLRQQVQPHLLFNALNVLKSLIKKDPQTAERYLLSLSDFLRSTLNKSVTPTGRTLFG